MSAPSPTRIASPLRVWGAFVDVETLNLIQTDTRLALDVYMAHDRRHHGPPQSLLIPPKHPPPRQLHLTSSRNGMAIVDDQTRNKNDNKRAYTEQRQRYLGGQALTVYDTTGAAQAMRITQHRRSEKHGGKAAMKNNSIAAQLAIAAFRTRTSKAMAAPIIDNASF